MARRRQKGRGKGGGRPTPKEVRHRRASRERERVLLIGAGAVVAAILLILAFGFYQERIAAARAPVAVVNGQSVSLQDYQAHVRYQRFNLLNTFGGQIDPQTLIPFLRDQLPQAIMDTMIEDVFIAQRAEESDITVSDAEVQSAIEEQLGFTGDAAAVEPTATTATDAASGDETPTPEDAGGGATMTREEFDQAYEQYLETIQTQASVSEDTFRDIIRSQLLREKVRDAVTVDVPTAAPQVQYQDILVETEEEAQAVRQRLLDGEDFATVAADAAPESAAPPSSDELQWTLESDLPSDIRDAVSNLPVGEISEPIEASNGFYIVEVLDRDEERPLTPTQLQQARDARFRQWLSEQSATANIERLWTPEAVPPLPPELQAAGEAPQPPLVVTAEPSGTDTGGQ